MIRAVVFDWGDTVMRNLPYSGPMAGWPRVEAVPGAEEALAALHPNYRLALATNAGDSGAYLVRAALGRVGLDRHFDAVLTALELGVSKPAPGFYWAVLQELGCAADEAAMVGDDYRGDVAGPKAVGLQAIWYNPLGWSCPVAQPVHDIEIRDLTDLPAALASPSLPDLADCEELLAGQEAPAGVLAHSRAVAAIAFRLAERLRAGGHPVDPLLAHRGGLLHDLDKVSSQRANRIHGQLGAEVLRENGYARLGRVVERHLLLNILDPRERPATWEEKLVYYADKVVEGTRAVSVPERVEALCGRYPDSAERVRLCLPRILELEAEVWAGAGMAAERRVEAMNSWLAPRERRWEC